MATGAGDGAATGTDWHGDVDILRRFCWRSPDRGDPRYFRVLLGDVARISDPPRLRIQEPVAIPPVIIPQI